MLASIQSRLNCSSLQRRHYQAGNRAPRSPSASVSCKSLCPYSALGVSATAGEQEIKRAYRKLALQYHPDISKAPDADRKFLSIQEAYELLTGRSNRTRGDGSAGKDGWDFHDWYWDFQMKRRWDSQHTTKASTSQARGYKEPEHQSTLRSQLAGLRHRAAIRSTARRRRQDSAATSSWDESVTSSMEEEEEEASTWNNSEMGDGCSSVSNTTKASSPPRRKFVATNDTRESLSHQLAGLKRKAAMKQAL